MPVMRSVLIALSCNKALQDLPWRARLARMARRFVSGEILTDAISAAGAQRTGMLATLDHLGENVTSEPEAIAPQTSTWPHSAIHAPPQTNVPSS